MKITDIGVTAIQQKLDSEFWVSVGAITHVSEVMVEVFTDQGVVGIGEAKTGVVGGRGAHET